MNPFSQGQQVNYVVIVTNQHDLLEQVVESGVRVRDDEDLLRGERVIEVCNDLDRNISLASAGRTDYHC